MPQPTPQADRYPTTWHQRLIRHGILLLACYLVLVAAWEPLIRWHAHLFPIQAGPSPTPPVLLISSNLHAGAVTINGQAQQGTLPLLVKSRSYNLTIEDIITVAAPPFQPKVCQLHLPDALVAPQQNSVCQIISLDDAGTITLNGITARPDYWVYIPFTAEDLPPDQQQAVTNLLTQSLTTQQQTSIPAGARIATSAAGASEQTNIPLRGSAILYPPSYLPPQQTYCGTTICAIGSPESTLSLPAGAWSIGAAVALRWRFTAASGAVVSDVSFPAVGQVDLLLSYTAADGWLTLTSSAADPPIAAQRSAQLSALLCSSGVEALRDQAGTDDISQLANSGLEGCELSLKTDQGETALFLWRFGVLLAANEHAQALFPGLPRASVGDLAAVEGEARRRGC